MKKLLLISLVIFFAICSKSWAEDKMEWKCGSKIFLIDIEKPEVYSRTLGKWEPMSSSVNYEKIIYDPDQENITFYTTEYIKNELGFYQTAFDLRYNKYHPMSGDPMNCKVSVFKE